MALLASAKKLVAEVTNGNVKLGDLKKRGKEIKKDHDLAMELWSTGEYYPRLLATLIFDNKLLTENVIDRLASDTLRHDADERTHAQLCVLFRFGCSTNHAMSARSSLVDCFTSNVQPCRHARMVPPHPGPMANHSPALASPRSSCVLFDERYALDAVAPG